MYLYGATEIIDGETASSQIKLEEVAYWRKQNAIHAWMVKNVQRGIDNCAMYYVGESTLKELLKVCNIVLANPTVENAMELLPTKGGFFFGGTDLEDDFEMEYYLDGLKYTVGVIKELIKDSKYNYYYYESSW